MIFFGELPVPGASTAPGRLDATTVDSNPWRLVEGVVPVTAVLQLSTVVLPVD